MDLFIVRDTHQIMLAFHKGQSQLMALYGYLAFSQALLSALARFQALGFAQAFCELIAQFAASAHVH